MLEHAESGHDPLIQQRRLEARFLSLARRRQHCGVEGVAERLGAEPGQQRLVIELCALDELHRTEAAWVVESNDRAGRHMKDHVVVGRMLRPLVMITAKLVVAAAAKHMKRS